MNCLVGRMNIEVFWRAKSRSRVKGQIRLGLLSRGPSVDPNMASAYLLSNWWLTWRDHNHGNGSTARYVICLDRTSFLAVDWFMRLIVICLLWLPTGAMIDVGCYCEFYVWHSNTLQIDLSPRPLTWPTSRAILIDSSVIELKATLRVAR